ncbi:unnamed protein product, partial [Didymodactylos carnosus]
YGFAAGVRGAPAGCEFINDACRAVLVKKGNHSELCSAATATSSTASAKGGKGANRRPTKN